MYGYEIFHEDILKELIDAVHINQNRHAYLFLGPDGVGKKEAARLFAASLACENTNVSPCGNCKACISARVDQNPDIKHIVPVDKKSISVEQARQIVLDAYIKPFQSQKKVYIIDDASLLTDAAQNCLLKVLEEPPEYVVFIIVTTSEDVILSTIFSRCTTVRFPAVCKEEFKKYIENNFPEEIEKIDLLYSISSSKPGYAKQIIENPDYDQIREQSFKMLTPLLSQHRISAYTICDFIEENSDNFELIFDLWIGFLRDIMLIQNDSKDIIMNIDLHEKLEFLANNLTKNHTTIALEQLITGKEMISKYVNLHTLILSVSFSIKNNIYKR